MSKDSCMHVYIRAYMSLWACTKCLITLFKFKILEVFIYSQGINSGFRNRKYIRIYYIHLYI